LIGERGLLRQRINRSRSRAESLRHRDTVVGIADHAVEPAQLVSRCADRLGELAEQALDVTGRQHRPASCWYIAHAHG
jgi:hypothetical protein